MARRYVILIQTWQRLHIDLRQLFV